MRTNKAQAKSKTSDSGKKQSSSSVLRLLSALLLPRSSRKLRINRYMFYTSLLVVPLFICLCAYMIKFMAFDSQNVITSPYNKRTTTLAERIVRGKIISANGKELAVTKTNEEGRDVRVYPYDDMFAQSVGYATHGKGGIESLCNYDLLTSHTDIETQAINGFSGKKNIGDNVYTTLDTRLQKAAYEALDDYRGAIIAIEPKTGRIRAMVSKPDFDPNELDDIWEDIVNDDSSSVLLNRCIQGLYPPGSTYKSITALEYLMEHPYNYGDFKYDCSGEDIINSVHIHCYNDTEHGEEDLFSAFAHSCNTSFVKIGTSLNRKKYIKLNNEFLFNQKIDSDLKIKNSRFNISEHSDKSLLPQTVIGQGDTLMTPIHNALVMCAIANDGIMMRPMIIDRIENSEGKKISTNSQKKLTTVGDKKSIQILKKMLRQVVTEGTGSALDTDEYTVAGKTGTAENEGEYAHSWFVGYSNVDDPDLVVCVLVENVGSGSKYAAPIASQVFDSYYNNELNKEYR